MNTYFATIKRHCLTRCIAIINALFAICILTNELNAEDAIKQFGLTGGTKGIGMKYSYFGKYFGVDIGFPFYYKYDNRIGDSVEFNYDFKIAPYFTFSAKVYKQERNEFAAGVSLFFTVEYMYKKGNDTIPSKSEPGFRQVFAPCLQYIRKNKENDKIFSFELFPLSFFHINKEELNLSPNVQLSIYLKE
jgi:hypothetical protein